MRNKLNKSVRGLSQFTIWRPLREVSGKEDIARKCVRGVAIRSEVLPGPRWEGGTNLTKVCEGYLD